MPNSFLPDRPRIILAEGGMETSFIFDEGFELPFFSSITLLREQSGVDALNAYYARHIDLARRAGTGLILDTPTWRASADWGDRLGYSRVALRAENARSAQMLSAIKTAHSTDATPILVNGCIGPRGDGYQPGDIMSPEAAEAYHDEQVAVLCNAGVDLIGAITLTNVSEAIGIARSARRHGRPCVISFTVETDGRLPTGQSLGDAINEVDQATDKSPAFFMINCAHPSHFIHVLDERAAWTGRLGGLRANASCKSHAELDASDTLDRGDPAALAIAYADISRRFPAMRVFGGCCGTDLRHVEAIASAVLDQPTDLLEPANP